MFLCSMAAGLFSLEEASFLWSSQIKVHPTPATSTMPPKFEHSEIKSNVLEVYPGGEVNTTSALANLGLSLKKVGNDIAKGTSD